MFKISHFTAHEDPQAYLSLGRQDDGTIREKTG